MLQATSRVTWEGIQTWMGTVVSQWRNVAYKHDLNVAYYHGATLVNQARPEKSERGVTLGNYINGRNMEASATDATFIHEFGHTRQSWRSGLGYVFVIGIPSLISCEISSNEKHARRWYERRATTHGDKFIDKLYKNGVITEHDVKAYQKDQDK